MEYNLKLTQQEIQVLFMALGEIPIKFGVNVLNSIQNQVTRQDVEAAQNLEEMAVNSTDAPAKESA